MKTFKQLFLSLSFILFTSLSVQAQKVIQPNEITPEYLAEIFDAALLEVTGVEEDYIKVKDVFEYYVDIDAAKRYVSFSASFAFKSGSKKADISEFLNRINTEVALVKAYTNDDFTAITYIYYFWTDGGFTAKSLAGSLKLVDAALNLCLDKDTRGVL